MSEVRLSLDVALLRSAKFMLAQSGYKHLAPPGRS